MEYKRGGEGFGVSAVIVKTMTLCFSKLLFYFYNPCFVLFFFLLNLFITSITFITCNHVFGYNQSNNTINMFHIAIHGSFFHVRMYFYLGCY